MKYGWAADGNLSASSNASNTDADSDSNTDQFPHSDFSLAVADNGEATWECRSCGSEQTIARAYVEPIPKRRLADGLVERDAYLYCSECEQWKLHSFVDQTS